MTSMVSISKNNICSLPPKSLIYPAELTAYGEQGHVNIR